MSTKDSPRKRVALYITENMYDKIIKSDGSIENRIKKKQPFYYQGNEYILIRYLGIDEAAVGGELNVVGPHLFEAIFVGPLPDTALGGGGKRKSKKRKKKKSKRKTKKRKSRKRSKTRRSR